MRVQSRSIRDCASKAWNLYGKFRRKSECIVEPSIPVIFFGSYARYLRSYPKVVTIGLNPSSAEFKPKFNPPFGRFEKGDWLERTWKDDDEHQSSYLKALEGYFDSQPYKKYFNTVYEPKLQRFGCSYYSTNETYSASLHTDICSPLATTPDWGELEQKEPGTAFLLKSEGVILWRDVVNTLAPDLMLADVREDLLWTVFPPDTPWSHFDGVPSSDAKWMWATPKPCLLIQGRIRYWNHDLQRDLAKRALSLLERN